MHQAPFSSYKRRVFSSLIIIMLLCFVSCSTANTPTSQTDTATATTTIATTTLLPGQHIWKENVSSYLFGTNDTYEYFQHNIETEPAIQALVRKAGFTLMRSFFPDNASDTAIEQRMRTIEQSGTQCLGVITNIANTTYNEHLLRILGKRCQMYEFGNESDFNGIPSGSYMRQWNTVIPLLRAIEPKAKFIGPVTYNAQGKDNYMRAFLEGVKVSGVLPDAVSFHWYPCYLDTRAACLAKASSVRSAVQSVRTLMQTILGKELPIGISEWNYDPTNPPPVYGDDATFISQFSTVALHAMASVGVAFACQFDAASYSGYGRLDMFNVNTSQPKAQYFAIKMLIAAYRP